VTNQLFTILWVCHLWLITIQIRIKFSRKILHYLVCLFSHLRLGVQSGLMPTGLLLKCTYFSDSHEFYMSRPSYPCFYHSHISSVSIVTDYGLEDFSSSLRVQTGSGAHPASCTMGAGDHFPGGKARPRRDADHSPHLVPRLRMSRSHTSSPPKRLRGV
jgi:hypothetical protein